MSQGKLNGNLGGAGGVALQLAEYFTNHGYNVTLVTQKRKNTLKYSFKIIQIPVVGKLWFVSYFIFFKLHNLKQYDKIIINDGGAIYSAGLSFDNETLAKSIVYVHGVEKYLAQHNIALKVMKFRKYYMRALDNSYKIVSVSSFIKDIFFKGVLNKFLPKVQTIYNGVDTTQFYYKKDDTLNKYNLNSKNTILISISRLVEKKGYLTKLRIFKKLLENDKDYKWFVIGDGDFKEDFLKTIRDEELTNNIFLLGKKDRNDLKYYLSESTFFWLLSDFDEAFPISYYEAMACKCIPIGWNKAGVKEVIENNINGCLANNENDVIEFIENGYEKINKEDLPNQVIKIEDNYWKVLN